MIAATNLRKVLMVSAASVALFACSDTDIASPGDASAPTTSPTTAPTTTAPTRTAVDFTTASVCTANGLVLSDVVAVGEFDVRTCALDGLANGGVIEDDFTIPRIADSAAPFGSVPVLIQGVTVVGEDAGDAAVLTIDAGAVVVGASGPDVLVVSRGSQLIAEGSAAQPIIFTSVQDLLDESSSGSGTPRTGASTNTGEWGGLVLNGFAPINDCDPRFVPSGTQIDDPAFTGTEGCQKDGEGNSGFFGGDDASDASGVLRYVQVKYAGFAFTPTNELNGIAFQGVGRGTTTEMDAVLGAGEEAFEFIQVHNNQDDGFEWFGGSANARYLVVTNAGDDSLDWTDGWNGNVQFALIQQAATEGDSGLEGDNREDVADLTPRSRPTFSNITFIGNATTADGTSLRLREGTGGLIANSIFVEPAAGGQCLRVDFEQNEAGIAGADLISTDVLNLESVLFDCGSDFRDDSSSDSENESQLLFERDSAFFVDVLFQEDDGDVIVGRDNSKAAGDGGAIQSNFSVTGGNTVTIEQFTGSIFQEDANGDDAGAGGGAITGAPTTVSFDSLTLTQRYFPGPSEFAVPALDLTVVGDAVDNADDEPGRTGVSAAFIASAAGDGSNGQGFDGSFFTSVDYIGAFGFDDRPDDNWATGWTFGVFDATPPASNCPDGTISTDDTISDAAGNANQPVCRLQGTVTGNVTLTAGNVYQLNGVVSVGEDIGVSGGNPSGQTGILTIEPGVTVYGVNGPDVLVVARGSQVIANGTETNPIVFTSDEDLLGLNTTGDERGQFGGVVINGRAPINDCDPRFGSDSPGGVGGNAGTDLCVKDGEGNSGFFGGSLAGDSSGVLRYVQVRYAGYRFTPQNELNGIAFQGVGNGVSSEAAAVLNATDEPFEFLQVHNNDDDGIEFFGGTANARYLVLTGNGDDSLDWTDGWVGNVQYVVIEQGNSEGDNGYEGDNRSGSRENEPRSNPTIANLTFVGGVRDGGSAFRLREGTAGSFLNNVIVEANSAALRLDAEQQTLVTNGDLELLSTFIDSASLFRGDSGNTTPAEDFFDGDMNNTTGTNTLQGFSFFSDGGGLVPLTGGAEDDVTSADLSSDAFFDNVDFIGAVAPGTAAGSAWFEGWTFVDTDSTR